jgi:hypothetical protein
MEGASVVVVAAAAAASSWEGAIKAATPMAARCDRHADLSHTHTHTPAHPSVVSTDTCPLRRGLYMCSTPLPEKGQCTFAALLSFPRPLTSLRLSVHLQEASKHTTKTKDRNLSASRYPAATFCCLSLLFWCLQQCLPSPATLPPSHFLLVLPPHTRAYTHRCEASPPS